MHKYKRTDYPQGGYQLVGNLGPRPGEDDLTGTGPIADWQDYLPGYGLASYMIDQWTTTHSYPPTQHRQPQSRTGTPMARSALLRGGCDIREACTERVVLAALVAPAPGRREHVAALGYEEVAGGRFLVGDTPAGTYGKDRQWVDCPRRSIASPQR
jgi:hypothetical protein